VLLTGSGAQDRDETINGHQPFAVLADHLTRSGVAVLRCDDRGFGKSTGNIEAATTLDFVSDADASVAFLALRPEIDKNAIGLLGHSEGGLVAPISASANPQVKYLVLLAAPAIRGREILLRQRHLIARAQGIPEAEVARTEPIVARVFDVAAGAASDGEAVARVRAILTPDVLAALGLPPAQKDPFVMQMTSRWMRQFLRLDPASYLAKIKIPVLALNGSLDTQIEVSNLRLIKKIIPRGIDVTTHRLEGLNHFFQTAKTGGPAEYREIAETMSPVALQIISRWIRQRLVRRPI
jgi:pimeloyl-ACP methyl ester carboxylesterase